MKIERANKRKSVVIFLKTGNASRVSVSTCSLEIVLLHFVLEKIQVSHFPTLFVLLLLSRAEYVYASRKRLRYCYFVCICASVISGISNCAQFVHKNVNTRAFCRHTTHAHAEGLNDSEKMLTIILVSASKGVGVSIRKVV